MTKNTASIQGTYVHWLTNICSLAHEHMFMDKRTYVLRMMMLVMMMMGVGEMWAQIPTDTDGEGYYYIINDQNLQGGHFYDASLDDNWYLCPAETNTSNNYWDNAKTQPFLTTYKDDGRQEKFLWIVRKNESYYEIIHKIDKMYLTANEYPGGNDKQSRRRVHIQEDYSDDALFTLSANGTASNGISTFNIIPKNKKVDNNTKYLNPAGENRADYGPETGYYGLIGFYTKDNAGSKWYFEFVKKCVTPEISVSADGVVTITSVTQGASIYYTTNGDTPDATSTLYSGASGTGPFTISGTTTVKAIAIKDPLDNSEVAEINIETTATPTIDQTNCDNTIAISCTDPGATIVYTTDGTEPTTTNGDVYSAPFVPVTGSTIRAKAFVDGVSPISAEATSITYTPLFTPAPTITLGDNNTVVINGTGSIYYTINGSDPVAGTSSQVYDANDKPSLAEGSGVNIIKAIAQVGGLSASCMVTKEFAVAVTINSVEGLAGIANNPDYSYKVTANIDASGLDESISGFTGTLDGGYFTISGLDKPLFTNLNGGTVKNVKLSGVDIDGTNVGAICDVAIGTTKIYNCGVLDGSVSGTNAGGLVGLIQENSQVRVVNCFNYGNVSASGSDSYAAGIVGKNAGTVGDVRIALCMMYGNVSDATHISPVYGGNHVSNAKNFTEYNYYLYSNERDLETKERIVKIPYTTVNNVSDYNDQLAIDKEEYLTRFPFYRHILNTHRELASYFLFGDYSEEHVNEIGHWAVKKGDDAHKYPMVEKWETNRKSTPTQTQNDLPNTTADYAGKLLTTMGSNGYLSVSIKIGSSNYSTSLPITDMDTLRYDYTYGKVILPFANEYEINDDYSKICTGWKITKVGSSTSSSVTNYNFADRDNLQKDIYDEATNPFIYAQGGYYVVPTGVTSIEITANFATAYYLSDATYEIGYNSSYGDRTGLGGNVETSFHSQTVYNSLYDVVNALGTTTTNPHKQAIVLVGNYHYDLTTDALKDLTGKGFTLMSIDTDNNQEPDYGFYSIAPDRPKTPALRFDFVPIISLGMAAKVNGSNYYPGVPIWKPRGWYEQTETTISIMNQFELDSGNFTLNETDAANKGKGKNPCIFNGGYFVQIIRSNNTNCSKVSYFKIGGNAYIKEFYPGSHSGHAEKWATIVPVNVTGGQVEECFMTGYKSGATAIGSDIRFWCSGGKIGKFLGAYMDKPKQTSNSDGNVNMTAVVDHALIGRFFGGGTSENATITGNINVTMNNSKVDFYCGGPEFGNMSEGKEVITNANNTKFGEYYGAGFGGTAITYSPVDGNPNIGANVAFTGYTFDTNRLTSSGSLGLATCYKFEYLMHSANKTKLVARFITGYANFSLATTGNVTNNLTGCTVEKDFYGAGCQGKVDGTVNSTLTNCTIKRSAFGGGYKATSNEVEVYPAAAPTLSHYYGETGIFSEFGKTTPAIFTWIQGTSSKQNTYDDCDSNGQGGKLYTSKDITMTDLGNVTGNITLTLSGTTKVGYDINGNRVVDEDGNPKDGDVFGGGNESKSLSNTTVILQGNTLVSGNVFGGGNKAEVSGTATVNIEYVEPTPPGGGE